MNKLIQLTDVSGQHPEPIHVQAGNINIVKPSGCLYIGCVLKMCGGEAVKVKETVAEVVALVDGLHDEPYLTNSGITLHDVDLAVARFEEEA